MDDWRRGGVQADGHFRILEFFVLFVFFGVFRGYLARDFLWGTTKVHEDCERSRKLAGLLFRNRFTTEEREAGKAALVLGISFITEGAIPYASKDPLRVIPAIMIGSGVAGIISMLGKVQLLVPHGGIFVLAIPNAVTNLLLYMIAIIAGTIVTALLLGVFKKR